MTDRFIMWWRRLPWYWKIPASVQFVGMIVIAAFELFGEAFKDKKQRANPYQAASDYRRKLEKKQREELRRKIREIDERYNERMRDYDRREQSQERFEDEITECDNVRCVDDALWGRKDKRADRNDDNDR